MSIKVQIKILDKKAVVPKYATDGSTAMDLRACIAENIVLAPGECRLIGTGLSLYIADKNYTGIIVPRSGLGHKHGLNLGNGTGVIDSDYQGEIMVSCFNRGQKEIIIEPDMRFAQLFVVPVIRADFEIVDDFFDTSERGAGGFGHTGV